MNISCNGSDTIVSPLSDPCVEGVFFLGTVFYGPSFLKFVNTAEGLPSRQDPSVSLFVFKGNKFWSYGRTPGGRLLSGEDRGNRQDQEES